MKTARFKLSALLLGVTAVLLSCGEPAPVGPKPQSIARQADVNDGQRSTVEPEGLLRCSELENAWARKTIGPLGGELRVGPHTLSVPAGALHKNVTITAVVPSDDVNWIHFEPQGLVFDKSASLTMSYANCELLGLQRPKRIAYAYDKVTIIYFVLSGDDWRAKTVTGKVDHFSEYAVAW